MSSAVPPPDQHLTQDFFIFVPSKKISQPSLVAQACEDREFQASLGSIAKILSERERGRKFLRSLVSISGPAGGVAQADQAPVSQKKKKKK
jgi:hypothetical protein